MSGMVVIEDLDVIDVMRFIRRKSKTFQAIMLNDLEEILGKDTEEFKRIRKLILDNHNNYTRSLLRVIFGDSFEDF